jgi:hypothetical protein
LLTLITLRSERNSDEDIRNNCSREILAVTITLNHFSAAAVFALFASIVFGITHRDTTREMVRYALYCFAMFLGGVLVAGWAMWVVRR